MNYKRLLPSKTIRLKLLALLNFLPDRLMIRLQYFLKTNRLPNLTNPKRYTEKIQWYKLNYRKPLMIICSDKVLVRNFVESRGLGNILNEIYGVYESPEEINFELLPNSFVLKYNNGSGVNFFVEDKSKVDRELVVSGLSKLIKNSNIKSGREWAYYDVKPKLLAERLFERDENNDIPDYKFFCFNGKVEYLYVMIGYVDNHDAGRCSFFTREFNKLNYRRSEYAPISEQLSPPKNFEEMLRIAETLSKGFPHVRVDLYNLNGQIFFGELTFYPASGYTVFHPDEFDFIMGDKFMLPDIQK